MIQGSLLYFSVSKIYQCSCVEYSFSFWLFCARHYLGDPTITLWGWYHCSHFIFDKTEAKRSLVIWVCSATQLNPNHCAACTASGMWCGAKVPNGENDAPWLTGTPLNGITTLESLIAVPWTPAVWEVSSSRQHSVWSTCSARLVTLGRKASVLSVHFCILVKCHPEPWQHVGTFSPWVSQVPSRYLGSGTSEYV